jgi:hypothetical protein
MFSSKRKRESLITSSKENANAPGSQSISLLQQQISNSKQQHKSEQAEWLEREQEWSQERAILVKEIDVLKQQNEDTKRQHQEKEHHLLEMLKVEKAFVEIKQRELVDVIVQRDEIMERLELKKHLSKQKREQEMETFTLQETS